MDIQIQNPNPGPNPHLLKAQEFVRLHSRELAAVGLFAFGCLTGYALGKARTPGSESEVVLASMVTPPKAKAKKAAPIATAKKAPAKTSSATAKAIAKTEKLAKAEKAKDKTSKKR